LAFVDYSPAAGVAGAGFSSLAGTGGALSLAHIPSSFVALTPFFSFNDVGGGGWCWLTEA